MNDYDEWFDRVSMLAEQLYGLASEDLPWAFFEQEYELNSTPRQALNKFEAAYL